MSDPPYKKKFGVKHKTTPKDELRARLLQRIAEHQRQILYAIEDDDTEPSGTKD